MHRFGDFEFRSDVGELRRVSPPPGGEPTRLAPQPARLLELLLERRGGLVEREEIRRELWPDTQVDVEQGLAFCVRQLRAALGDSAASPRYVETLPRRGFRLLVPIVEDRSAGSPDPAPDAAPGPHRRRRGAGWLLASIVVAALLGLSAHYALRAPSRAPRLAIMPFELAAEEPDDRARLARISEMLVADLARDGGRRIEVVGPRSTADYHGAPFPDLEALDRDLDVDYVLNCRYLADAGETLLLVELIRLDDGAHPWVERFDGGAEAEAIAAVVRRGVGDAILPSR